MRILELGTNRVIVDFTGSDKVYNSVPRFVDETGQSYERDDGEVVANDAGGYKLELTCEFQELDASDVAALEDLYQSRTHFVVIPDPDGSPTLTYVMRWQSDWERQDTVATNWTRGRSVTVVFREVGSDAVVYTPVVRIEIEGVDLTGRRVSRSGLTVGKSLDYPELLTFRSSGTQFTLDNADGVFDYSSPDNFFVARGKPAHGRGAKVLIKMGLSDSEMAPVFAGQVSGVQTALGHTRALIKVRDISLKLRQNRIETFGEEITRRITDFDGANADYDDLDPVFYFPAWGLPIARGSVSLVVNGDGGDTDITVVDTIATSGTLSNTRAEIDYNRGLIRFEQPPTDGADTEITATWKLDFKYKRPDFLIRQLLKHSGLQSELGITDDKVARFGIEQALVSHPTDESFSSHGRPYPQENGVVRWMKRDDSGDTPVWGMIQDQRYLEYDEYQDTYTKVATLPEESGLSGVVPNDYGQYLANESFEVDMSIEKGIAIDTDMKRIYATDPGADSRILSYLFDGTEVTSEAVNLDRNVQESLGVDDDYFYCGLYYGGRWRVYRFSRTTGARDTSFDLNIGGVPISVDITPTRIIAIGVFHHIIWITDKSGNRIQSEERTFVMQFKQHLAVEQLFLSMPLLRTIAISLCSKEAVIRIVAMLLLLLTPMCMIQKQR